ncbi:DUF2809 domain-containing protein [Clostridium folliculivorans]|uniref:Membrane protein n=1 Tax=Clostridium folliculivorans TaxID=2886038 RepID=A0A9W5Y428_9CLOT|nr:DUF2809 domain-containing protein [Clostridium folliculivorans]GKU26376.1 membrane protein [Clostridium folliculivorans]GKU32069.1 membrane protein [Clostridium folliculivorans]
MKINIRYILSFIILFIIETLIALYVHDAIVRPYIGDILVVILLYTLVRGIITKRIKFLPVYLFLFASAVEVIQYFKFIDLLHLRSNRVASVILGTSFDIKDILCYLAGSIILIMWEQFVDREI